MGVPMRMAAGHLLPDPEQIGTSGYVWEHQFDLALPNVRPTHPHIWINNLRWLRHVLRYLGVQQVQSETFQVSGPKEWQARVDFAIPRLGHGGRPQEISVYGLEVAEEELAEKFGVDAALKLLVAVGYKIPTYSSMVIEAMDEEAHYQNVEDLCLAKARNNTVHLVPAGHMTYAGCNFEAIFNQIMIATNHTWEYAPESPMETTGGFQAKLIATRKGSTTGPSLIVVSRPCRRRAKATESVLCTALAYISDVCGCKIGDLHYGQILIRRFQRQYPSVLPP